MTCATKGDLSLGRQHAEPFGEAGAAEATNVWQVDPEGVAAPQTPPLADEVRTRRRRPRDARRPSAPAP
jgi:hypothetical protein